MNIFFDHQIFSEQTYGGISRYYTELIDGINHTVEHRALCPLVFSNNIHLEEKNIRVNKFFINREFPKKVKIIYSINKHQAIKKIKANNYDVFHSTYYDPYFLPYLKKKPLVVTFLDMIHEKFGDQFPVELAYDGTITKQKQLLAERADRIIAISESTKRDIVELLNINPAKIDVIYLGNSLVPSQEKAEMKDKNMYFLFVGNRSMYKNFRGLLEAICDILKKHNVKLICAGGGGFSKAEVTLIHSLGVNDFVKQISINDHALISLYKGAVGFIFPSMYEGFGIPVLEAFACGCPTIVSNVSSLPEVAGDAVLYIDPLDHNSIRDAVEKLLHDTELPNILVEKGYEQLAKFSWQKMTKETVDLYKDLA